jgi:hypothetical protein
MHLTLKKEATKPAAKNFLQQQARFDKFTEVFNNERPHEALDMKCPAEVYQPSPRPYTGLSDIDYSLHDKTIVVTRCGRICLGRKKSISARSLPAKPSASKKCTEPADSTLQPNQSLYAWESAVLKAVLETNNALLPSRIAAARSILADRLASSEKIKC